MRLEVDLGALFAQGTRVWRSRAGVYLVRDRVPPEANLLAEERGLPLRPCACMQLPIAFSFAIFLQAAPCP